MKPDPFEFGFPLPYYVIGSRMGPGGLVIGPVFSLARFLIDIGLALSTAYLAAVALDRFIFRPMRSARMRESERKPESPR
jgi:hypothetical protein